MDSSCLVASAKFSIAKCIPPTGILIGWKDVEVTALEGPHVQMCAFVVLGVLNQEENVALQFMDDTASELFCSHNPIVFPKAAS
jgi:hypothetical protein